MSTVNGGIQFNSHQLPAGGGGGGVATASSGLNLVGTDVQLGSVGTPLLQNTEIVTDGFSFIVGDTGNIGNGSLFVLNDTAEVISFQTDFFGNDQFSYAGGATQRFRVSFTGQPYLVLDIPSQLFQLGDISGVGNAISMQIRSTGADGDVQLGNLSGSVNATTFTVDDQNSKFEASSQNNIVLSLNKATNTYKMGDTNAIGNSTLLQIRDTIKQIDLIVGAAGDVFKLIGGATRTATISLNSGDRFFIDEPNALYKLGDLSLLNNGGLIELDDNNNTFKTKLGSFDFISLTSSRYRFGDVNSISGQSLLDIDNQDVTIRNGGGTGLLFNTAALTYAIGDLSAINNSSKLTIDDAARQVVVSCLNGIKTIGDTVLMHTGTALTNAAGAALGTLANAPTAGNPSKWITIDDNGTVRKIPTWL